VGANTGIIRHLTFLFRPALEDSDECRSFFRGREHAHGYRVSSKIGPALKLDPISEISS
jgi:hypothetical protein